MKKILLILSLTLSFSSFAEKCRLPKGQKIIVGCSRECSFSERSSLQFTGFFEGHKVDFVNLTKYPDQETALKSIDALLVPGGADINPDYYMDDVTEEMRIYLEGNRGLANVNDESNKRDPFEHSILTKYSTEDSHSALPLLGICRGMQMMTVVQGIPLYLDIKTELGIPNRIKKLDRVRVQGEKNIMRKLYGESNFLAWELHHQGLRMPYYLQHQRNYPNVKVTATSHNGKIAEAIEWTHRTALGVQFHPELSPTRASYPVLSWLLNRACEYKTSKDHL